MIDWVELGKASANVAVLKRAREITGTDALDAAIAECRNRMLDVLRGGDHEMSIDSVVSAVSHITGVSVAQIVGRSHQPDIAEARKIAYYVAVNTGFTNKLVASYMGRHHSTVVSGRQSIQNLMDVEESVREKVEEVEALL